MRPLYRLGKRLLNLTFRRRSDERLKEEIETHLAHLIEENLRNGLKPEEARRQARLKLGAVEAIREECRDEESLPLFEDLLMDIRYALRVLWKSPAFTLVALVTLTLGIGANIFVFGVVNAVLLHPLDVSDPQNLYQLRLGPRNNFKLLTTSYPAFEDYRARNSTFSELAGFYGYSHARLGWGKSVKNVSGYAVTGNYFAMLGVQPELGRLIQPSDEHGPNSAPYIVLSDSLWRSAFNANPGVIGTIVRLNNDSYSVIGVTPVQFHGTEQFVWPDYYIPIVNYFGQDELRDRTGRPLTVLGRLKAGVTPQQAAENLSAIARQLAKEYPRTDTGVPLRLVHPGLYADDGDVIRGFLYSVTVLALLVLMAAGANLASLFAARAADRGRELALRVALGASRWRLVRQLFTEAIVLSMLGGAAGLATAGFLLRALNRRQFDGLLSLSPDARVYLAAFVFTLVSALLFGMIPAREIWRSSPLQAMKSGPVQSGHWRGLNLRDLLLVTQIAICMLLVTASLVAVRGMIRMMHTPLGFQPQGIILAETDFQLVQGKDVSLEKKKAMLDAVRSISGVTNAGILSRSPLNGGIRSVPVFRPGTIDLTPKHSVLESYQFTISPGYLETARTRLLQGRDVSWRDTKQTPYVALVNQTFAQKMWGENQALGQRFIFLGHLREVIGVVEDGKYHEMTESLQPAIFLPLSQDQQIWPVFVVRSQRTQRELTPELERTLTAAEPDVLVRVEGWPDTISFVLLPTRMAAAALGVMGLLAVMLAMTGIFGMAAYNVSRRMKELGIRVALGARSRHITRAAIGRPIALLGLGSLGGLLLGIFASRLLGQIVYEANPRDPLVIGGAIVTMTLLGLIASALPALRALAVDPSRLLRAE